MAVYRKGADPEALERGARRLHFAAAEVGDIRAAGAVAVSALARSWTGADADRAQHAWQAVSVRLDTFQARLDELATRLSQNSVAQREASGQILTHAGAAAGPVSQGVVGPPPFSDDVRGTEPQDLDLELARIAENVYDPSEVDGWEPLDDDELEELGFDPDLLHDIDGYDATVYEQDGRYVLAYQGTDPTSVKDWAANLTQGTGQLSTQHVQAISAAEALQDAVGDDNVVLTGHSLGGGLAATSAAATGLPAVTFNAAGVHPNTLAYAALQGGMAGVAPDQVRNYYVEGELLSTLQNPGLGIGGIPVLGNNFLLPDSIGTQIKVEPAEGPEVEVSPWSALSPAVLVADVALDLGGYAVDQHKGGSVVDALEESGYFDD